VRRRSSTAWIALLVVIVAMKACDRDKKADDQPDRTDERIEAALAPASAVTPREGLAAAIVIDVSGSMADSVAGLDGRSEPKIAIARRAARDLVEQFARYADDHKEEPVLLGLYEFSRRRGEADCRPVIEMGPPDRTRAEAAIERLKPEGGTPIGQAMITAKRQLDGTGLSRRHLLLVTDGENTDGFAPDRVARVIERRPSEERPSIYFVAFDLDAKRFAGVRDAGGLVLPAANARELNDTLDSLLRGKILLEK
jgi:Mg-chelatase subunit ChlD